jgi:TonB family protein
MKREPSADQLVVHQVSPSADAPGLLVEFESWHTVFLRNCSDLLRPQSQPGIELSSSPGNFWPDVFVTRRPAWRSLAGSLVCHLAVVSILVGASQFWPASTVVRAQKFSSAEVIRYVAAEYLPPINTETKTVARARKGQPEHARQEIISVPPESDNRTQTLVAPPKLKLNHDVPMPNMVAAWSSTVPVPSAVPAPPMADLKMSPLPASVVSPPPALDKIHSKQNMEVAVGDVVAPAPTLADSLVRKFGDLNLAHSEVVAPAPKLMVAEQRVPSFGRSALANSNVVAPPPSVQAGANSRSGGSMIALGIHPAPPQAAPETPAGNRRGTFAATPDGKSGAPGTTNGTSDQEPSTSRSGQARDGLPRGLVVAAGPKAGTSPVASGTSLTADAAPPRVSTLPHAVEPSKRSPTEIEKQVFGDRKIYSMTLNMPNLNSAGGSWVIHFAELKNNSETGDLSTPVPTHEVDPGYPMELMRQNVKGTVTLHAVIRSDGSVGTVQVLRGIDDRLDEYARSALSRWRFQPATKNGKVVDLEAVVIIPFRPGPRRNGF